MAWKPFVNERSLAIQAFKQAIIDQRGYIFRKFKESRQKQKTFLRKLLIGVPSNYHEIVKKHLAIVYLGYVSYLNLFELGGTDLSGGWLKEKERLNGDGFRDLSEYHFFAIDYVDTGSLHKALDKAAKKLGAEAELAALRAAAPDLAKKAMGIAAGGVHTRLELGDKLGPFYRAAKGAAETVKDATFPSAASFKEEYTDALERAQGIVRQGPSQADLSSLAPPNQASYGSGESGGLRMGLTDNYGPQGVNILDWQLLCVRQTTIVNIAKSPITCSGLGSISTGPVQWEAISSVVNGWDSQKRHLPRVFDRGIQRSYWRESGKSDLKFYDSTLGGEFEKIMGSKFEDWVAYGKEGPRKAVIAALPDLPDGVGPIADIDLPQE
jgi:hypothetical protein